MTLNLPTIVTILVIALIAAIVIFWPKLD